MATVRNTGQLRQYQGKRGDGWVREWIMKGGREKGEERSMEESARLIGAGKPCRHAHLTNKLDSVTQSLRFPSITASGLDSATD